jgi:hypothetical protein
MVFWQQGELYVNLRSRYLTWRNPKAYYLFTLDKILSSLIKQVNIMHPVLLGSETIVTALSLSFKFS